MKKHSVLMILLCARGLLFAGTQDFVKCDVIYKKPNVLYFNAGGSDGVAPGESFEIFYDERLVTTGRIAWADQNISRSEELDSTVFAEVYYYDDLEAKINLFVPQANRGGFINVPYFSDLNLEPSAINTADEKMVGRLIHRGLLTRNENGDIVPDLAGVYEVRALTYTFYIRPDAGFHSGKPVEATDVAYSLEQLALSPKLTAASCFILGIKGAEEFRHGVRNEISGLFLINKETISITLKQPFPAFEEYLAGPAGYIIPRPGLATPGGSIVGAGMYKIKWRNQDGLTVGAYTSDAAAGLLDSIRFIRFTSLEEAALAFELGRLDLISVLGSPPPKFISREEHSSMFTESFCSVILGVNGRRDFQRDQAFSRALSFMFDRETIIRVILGGSARIPESPIPGFGTASGMDFELNPDSANYYLNSIEKLPSTVTLYINSRYPVLENVARYVVGQLQNRGIIVEEKRTDLSFFEETDAGSRIDLYLDYVNPVSDDPDCLIFPLYSYILSGQTNFLYYDDNAFQAFLDKLRAEKDLDRRNGIAYGLSQSLAKDPPAVILYQPHLMTIMKTDISGLKPLDEGFLDLRGAYIEFER
jgi:peptide/nickel transport system substrate-binding protein